MRSMSPSHGWGGGGEVVNQGNIVIYSGEQGYKSVKMNGTSAILGNREHRK